MTVLYIHIPKTGGTSISSALSSYDNEVITQDHTIYKSSPKHGSTYNKVLNFQLSRAEHFRTVIGEEIYNNAWSVAIVRNPWDRYISNWKWLTRESCKYNNYTKNSNSVITFETFVKESIRCYGTHKSAYDHQRWHIRNQIEHIVDSNGNIIVDHIGRFEKLQEEFDLICKKSNLDLQLPHLNRVGHYSAEPEKSKPISIHYSEYYNQELIDIVADRCKKDIDLFKYDYEEKK